MMANKVGESERERERERVNTCCQHDLMIMTKRISDIGNRLIFFPSKSISELVGTVENTDCISAEG